MKKLNEFIREIGTDKVMHFFVGMIIVAQFDRFGWEIGLVGVFVNLCIQIAKEKYVDEKPDYGDTAAGFMGSIAELAISAVIGIVF